MYTFTKIKTIQFQIKRYLLKLQIALSMNYRANWNRFYKFYPIICSRLFRQKTIALVKYFIFDYSGFLVSKLVVGSGEQNKIK